MSSGDKYTFCSPIALSKTVGGPGPEAGRAGPGLAGPAQAGRGTILLWPQEPWARPYWSWRAPLKTVSGWENPTPSLPLPLPLCLSASLTE